MSGSLAWGSGLVAVALAAGWIEAHFRRLPAWDRPAWALGPLYGAFWRPARRLALGSGLVLLAMGSPLLAGVTSLILACLWGWIAWRRSISSIEMVLRRRILSVRAERPDLSEPAARRRVLSERHPEWGPELVETMVERAEAIRDLARMVARMEREWSR